jgi:hypothetical protein
VRYHQTSPRQGSMSWRARMAVPQLQPASWYAVAVRPVQGAGSAPISPEPRNDPAPPFTGVDCRKKIDRVDGPGHPAATIYPTPWLNDMAISARYRTAHAFQRAAMTGSDLRAVLRNGTSLTVSANRSHLSPSRQSSGHPLTRTASAERPCPGWSGFPNGCEDRRP